jgi:hypothetical protein
MTHTIETWTLDPMHNFRQYLDTGVRLADAAELEVGAEMPEHVVVSEDVLRYFQGLNPQPPYDDEHYMTMLVTYDEISQILADLGYRLAKTEAVGTLELNGEGN